jgi:hypothetical protein
LPIFHESNKNKFMLEIPPKIDPIVWPFLWFVCVRLFLCKIRVCKFQPSSWRRSYIFFSSPSLISLAHSFIFSFDTFTLFTNSNMPLLEQYKKLKLQYSLHDLCTTQRSWKLSFSPLILAIRLITQNSKIWTLEHLVN